MLTTSVRDIRKRAPPLHGTQSDSSSRRAGHRQDGAVVDVRTDCELQCPELDRAMRELVDEYVLLPDDVSTDELRRQTR